MNRVKAVEARVDILTSTVFLGIDGAAAVLLDDRRRGGVLSVRAPAVIAALGAVETIRPFPGWELPGVMSAGGAQVLLKETGRPPEGRILVAGSGPLPLAVTAQLAKSGNAPVALLERGQPWKRLSAVVETFASPAHIIEAAGYAAQLAISRVPYVTGAEVISARPEQDGLVVSVRRGGSIRDYRVRHLIVHDGLRPNDVGIPADVGVPVITAGDCHQILGADAAILDGARAAATLVERLGLGRGINAPFEDIARARRLQVALNRMFHTPRAIPAAETIICRCEALRQQDLAVLPVDSSGRETRLLGRFGMGACQGRFCRDEVPPPMTDESKAAVRWPLRPVSVAALANLQTFPFPEADQP